MASAIAIPLARSPEALVIYPHELSDGIITVLKQEQVPLEIWLECARGLLGQGQVDAYTTLLRAITVEATSRRDPSPQARFVHVQALCSLADLHLQQARLAEDVEQRRELHTTASNLYFAAQRVDHREMLPHMGLGEFAMSTVRMGLKIVKPVNSSCAAEGEGLAAS